MNPGERKFVLRAQLLLMEAYEQRDDPPGRDPVGIRTTVIVANDRVVPATMLQEVIEKVLSK